MVVVAWEATCWRTEAYSRLRRERSVMWEVMDMEGTRSVDR